ncbi:MAG: aminotransferase class III-fold pyridoxal phosphate-dependent enzyme [Opitutae bacterium]|nr:aminotransferase class III-fold pyridoxal phosphate-dependent enzyme [Opitutae bacterium]
MSLKRDISDSLFSRALKVIPGGIYGHVAPIAGLPRHFPHYTKSASGCRFEDVDGNEWLDFMCGFGAILHGYSNSEIEESAHEQRSKGAVFNQPSQIMVELAELLTTNINFADWSVFAKNGSDLTTWAIRVAREETGRPFVVKAKGAYHGVDAWCDPGFGGRVENDRSHVLEFSWNNLDEFRALLENYRNQISSVILTPYHHAAFGPSILPDHNFWPVVEEECKNNGIILILDDVRAGGRLDDGGSHRYFDFTPDLSVYSKALGNGFSISACVGKEFLKAASKEVFLTGSCWNDAVAMAAAHKSLQISQRDQVAQSVLKKGDYFCSGLVACAQDLDLPFTMTGPSSMPYPWFEGDDNLFLIQKFCELAAGKGLYFHPHHNWFISNAMEYTDLDLALELAGQAMNELKNLN